MVYICFDFPTRHNIWNRARTYIPINPVFDNDYIHFGNKIGSLKKVQNFLRFKLQIDRYLIYLS